MKRLTLLMAVLALGTASYHAQAQTWIEATPYPNWNTPASEFLHAPALTPGSYHLVSDRDPSDLYTLPIAGCKARKVPYRVYQTKEDRVILVNDPGTERWAGVPVYSKDRKTMAVPVWSDSCREGQARMEILVYKALAANASGANLTYDGVPYILVYEHGWPTYTQAQHPNFNPRTGTLFFSAQKRGETSYDLYTWKGGNQPAELHPASTSADEVYPTHWGDTLFYSVSTVSRGLDIVAYSKGQCVTLPGVVNSAKNDYNLIVHAPDSAWLNSNRNGHADLWYLFGPDDAQTPATAIAATPAAAPAAPAPASTPAKPAPAAPAKSTSAGPIYTVILGSFKTPETASQYIQEVKGKLPPQNALKINQANGNYRVGAEVAGPKPAAVATLGEFRKLVPNAWLSTDQRVSSTPGAGVEIYFDFDQAVIRAGEAARINAYLKAIEGQQGTFDLAGHCDARGNYDYNVRLGFRRAEAVKAFVEKTRGPITANLSTRSESDLQSPCPDNTPCAEEQHQLNRRVVLTFYPN